jgi:DNA-binding CsgD family transcriptional regulator
VVRGELHARAARLLWLSREASESVALHLVNSPGSGDAEVAAFLAEEGEAALDAGSIALAAQLLHRSLQEPAGPDERPRILVALGRAEHSLARLESAREHLEAAMESQDRAVALTAAAELFDVLLDAGRYAELGRFHDRVVDLDPSGRSEPEVRLQGQLLANVLLAVEPGLALPSWLADIDADNLPLERDIDRYLLVIAAIYQRTMQRGSTQRLVDNLRRAVGALDGLDDGTLSVWDARTAMDAAAFLADDEVAEADGVLERVAPSVARLRSSAPVLHADLENRRVLSAMCKGDFDDALATVALIEQRTAPDLARFTAGYRFVRGWIAFQRGDYQAAGELMSGRTSEDTIYPALGALLAGQPERVLEMVEAQGLSTDADGPLSAIEVELDPHLWASHAFEILGDRDGAKREAAREVAIRRQYGPRFRLAQALRRQASFEPSRRAVVLLAEALELAESTPRRPVIARVLASYGAALRRVERIPEAREALYRAVDMAGDMGMARLRERAHQELLLAGGRPRRVRATGPESLTAAQQQVARLASAGRSNRQIAEELFVTIKTVETHLAAAYRKLGITARDELAAMLAPGDQHTQIAAAAATLS